VNQWWKEKLISQNSGLIMIHFPVYIGELVVAQSNPGISHIPEVSSVFTKTSVNIH